MGQQLGPQAQTQHRSTGFQADPDQGQLRRHPAVGRIVAIGHPHRAAEHHQDLAHGVGAGERISLVQTADTPGPAPFRHQIRQGSRPHQLLVLEEHHLGNAGGGHRIRDIPISIERSVPAWRS
jgi:hypothetical protein